MALARKYEIPLQELPLLCVRPLQSWTVDADGTAVFPETEMIEYANRRREAKDLAERKRHMYQGRSPAPEVTPSKPQARSVEMLAGEVGGWC